MPKPPTKQRPLLSGALALAAAVLALAGVHFLVAEVIPEPKATFVSSALAVVFLWVVRFRGINLYEIVGRKYLDSHTGIVRVYPSLHHAFADLKAGFAKARRVDLLLHIGRREFGGKDSLFADMLRERASDPDLEVRILHFDENSPFLSEENAKRLGKSRTTWLLDVGYVRGQIDEICKGHPRLCVASHHEPFVWRLFIFDNEMFVSGYLTQTRNDEQAPVFKIRSGRNSLYAAFRAYYEHLWGFYAPGAAKPVDPDAGAGSTS